MTRREFKRGDLVGLSSRIKNHTCPIGREDNKEAHIGAVFGKDGECWLTEDLHGCKYWNQDDLVLIKAVD